MKLHVEPRVVKTWTDFLKSSPGYSIALDGYVYGKPEFVPDSDLSMKPGPRVNFNHHEEVARLPTRSTCGQVYVSIKQGLLDAFRKDGKVEGNVFVNDPDQDTCLSYWLLENHERIVGSKSEPLINRLVYIEDLMDVTAGAYPFDPISDVMRQMAWVFEPYTAVRAAGSIPHMNASEMENVISAVCKRISDHTMGMGKEINPNVDYDMLERGKGWVMIREVGAHARSKLFSEGWRAFVSVREIADGRYAYVLGKMSPYVPFPIDDLYPLLNDAEGIQGGCLDRWGGSDIIGGSPRGAGSSLNPGELKKLIDDYIASCE